MGLRNQSAILASNKALIKQNLALLRDFFVKHKSRFAWAEPAGSSVAFPRIISGTTGCDPTCFLNFESFHASTQLAKLP